MANKISAALHQKLQQKLPKNPTPPKFTFKNFGIALLLAIWVFFCIVFGQAIVYYIFISFITTVEQLELPLMSAIFTAVSYTLSLLLIVFVPWLIAKKPFTRTTRAEIGLTGTPTWTDILLAPAAFVVYILLASLAVAAFTLFPWFQADQAQDVGFNNLTNQSDLLIGFVTLVIIAPIAEELIFRGWLYGKFRTIIPIPLAFFLTSLLFGILHGQWNIAVDVFVLSTVLCLQRELTGTIYSGILLHMLKNAIAFFLLYVVT